MKLNLHVDIKVNKTHQMVKTNLQE